MDGEVSMVIIFMIFGGLVLMTAVAGVVCYYKLAVPNRKPLSEEERKICAQIVRKGKGYPFVCRQAVKIGQCPCLPCARLEKKKLQC
jgi:hypothetical protein